MAPRKNKNKIIHEAECSAAAGKRRRIELLNATAAAGGVTFTNPIAADFPSIPLLHHHHHHRNPPPITAGFHLSPPSPFLHRQDEENTADDDALSSLISQQNFIINYHMSQMLLTVNEFWRSNFAEEVKKRKEMEASLKQKEELADRFRQMYHYYEERTCLLEDMLQRRMMAGGEDCSGGAGGGATEEEVQSCFLDLNNVAGKTEMVCKNCRSRPATMLWLPCRHLYRKGKNIIINDEAATSTNPPPNTASIDLELSPPPEIPSEKEDANDDDDMNEMQRSVEEFWRTNLSKEIKKRKEMERKLEDKEQQMVRFRDMYHYYDDRAFLLEEKLHHMVAAGEGCSAAAAVGVGVGVEEEVDSCYVVETRRRRRHQLACLNCLTRPSTMVWLPCRHLCVCLVCEKRVKNCPVCGAKKAESVIINAVP
ncbi:hypothetical protein OSB04_026318 [Centaurea solstitialis]|uniref:RING-type domain-containing protein n=1 Tax=Centaurea solstitialis TaxID=347529 RepID=A0AA38VVI4_9ASTR|nr:hypothetical protein OSB04_026318 [Centaurea solstitialis]